MDYRHLNLLNFVLYLELLFGLVTLFQVVIMPLILVSITSIFNVVSYKSDAFALYFNIPFTIIEIVSLKIIVDVNTLDNPTIVPSIFYCAGAFILIVNQLIHRKSIYELAVKENDFLLKYTTWKFSKLINWLFPVMFLLIIFIPVHLNNPLSNWLFIVLNWISHLKYIGWLLPLISGLLLIGSINYAIFFLFNFRKIKRDFEAGLI